MRVARAQNARRLENPPEWERTPAPVSLVEPWLVPRQSPQGVGVEEFAALDCVRSALRFSRGDKSLTYK